MSTKPDFRALRAAAQAFAPTADAALDEVIKLLRDLRDPVAIACLDEFDPKLSKRVQKILKALGEFSYAR